MAAALYFDLVREMKESIYNHRLRLVESAQQRGIKPTARLFSTTVPTVRKWAAALPTAGTFRATGSLPRSSSPVAANASGHRGAAAGTAKILTYLLEKIQFLKIVD